MPVRLMGADLSLTNSEQNTLGCASSEAAESLWRFSARKSELSILASVRNA